MVEWRYSYIIIDLSTRWMWSSPRPRERAPSTCCIGGGWVDPRDGLDTEEWRKVSCPCQESNPSRRARGPYLYGLSCPCTPLLRYSFVGSLTTLLVRRINSAALVRQLTIPTERLPLAGEVSANFVVDKVVLGQVFSEYFGFPCQSLFQQLLQKSSSSIIWGLYVVQ
jgi:hypothetical protein